MRILRGTAVWLCGVCLCVTVWAADDATGPEFSFGAIADCQYCKVESKGRRKYSLSPEKLTRCVTHLNQLDLAFVVHLGDFIDRDFDSFSVVGPIYNQLKAPHHHVLGNHDFSVADDKKALVPATMGLADRYYAVATNGWRFIMLDGNDISFHAYPKNSAGYQAAVAYYEHLGRKAPGWNGALGPDQLAWLEAQLTTAGNENQSVALFCHFPVYPPMGTISGTRGRWWRRSANTTV